MTTDQLKIWWMGIHDRALLVLAEIAEFFRIQDLFIWAIKEGVTVCRQRAVLLAEHADTPEERDKLLRDSAELVQLLQDKLEGRYRDDG